MCVRAYTYTLDIHTWARADMHPYIHMHTNIRAYANALAYYRMCYGVYTHVHIYIDRPDRR